VTITDGLGNKVAELTGANLPGLHRVTWDLRSAVGIGPVRFGPLVAPGDYVVQLRAGNQVLRKKVRVEAAE
jgi:hypothetical protein